MPPRWFRGAGGNVGRVADALPGRPSPLGATLRDGGINFAVASSVAEGAQVCLFDSAGAQTRFELPDYDAGVWHGFDTTGTGNSLDAGSPVALRLIMDSLRYWLTEMHVDGFRFDLAATLARQDGGFSRLSAFFDLVAQDPVVSQAKLIAEPWDVGQLDSYDLGRFPSLWREWNGRYRDSMRDFWRSRKIGLGEFATRFAGSSDLYGGDGRDRRLPRRLGRPGYRRRRPAAA